MKNINRILVLCGVAIIVFAFAFFVSQYKHNVSSANPSVSATENETENEKAENLEVVYANDYLYITPQDVINHSDLVVVATLKNRGESYMAADQRAHTVEYYSVEKVLKGSYSQSEIEISRLGGEVPLKEYLKTQDSEQIIKKGLDKYSEKQLNEIKIRFVPEEKKLQSLSESNTKYLLCLVYAPEENRYIALSDDYGILKYKEETDEVFDIDSNNYVSNPLASSK